jgi:hypothetical protein
MGGTPPLEARGGSDRPCAGPGHQRPGDLTNPSTLILTETSPSGFTVELTLPVIQGRVLKARPVLPSVCVVEGDAEVRRDTAPRPRPPDPARSRTFARTAPPTTSSLARRGCREDPKGPSSWDPVAGRCDRRSPRPARGRFGERRRQLAQRDCPPPRGRVWIGGERPGDVRRRLLPTCYRPRPYSDQRRPHSQASPSPESSSLVVLGWSWSYSDPSSERATNL